MPLVMSTNLQTGVFKPVQVSGFCSTGSDRNVLEEQRRFMSHANCRESYGFEEGKSYLIMGHSVDLPVINKK